MTEKKIRSIEVTATNNFIEAELLKKTLIVHKQSEIIEDQGKDYQINSMQQEIEVGFQEALLTENQVFINNCISQSDIEIPDLKSSIQVLRIAKEITTLLI